MSSFQVSTRKGSPIPSLSLALTPSDKVHSVPHQKAGKSTLFRCSSSRTPHSEEPGVRRPAPPSGHGRIEGTDPRAGEYAMQPGGVRGGEYACRDQGNPPPTGHLGSDRDPPSQSSPPHASPERSSEVCSASAALPTLDLRSNKGIREP